MKICLGELADIERIVALDHSYMTDRVWQMTMSDRLEELSANFHATGLPRPMRMAYPHDRDSLRRVLYECDYLWVVRTDDDPSSVIGYLALKKFASRNCAWITSAAIAPDYRRKKIFSRLVVEAMKQCRESRLPILWIDVQTKNAPAILACQDLGLHFSGYADNYYNTQDIGVFFSMRVR
jgi:ribosomal protein S18 acetylase RimI-like enzyme